jgi:Domain of unknown function (DUF4365)
MTVFTDEIEHKANLLVQSALQSLFQEANLKLKPYELNKEKGIDFNFEIETRTEIPDTIGMFHLQNKGKDSSIDVLKVGKNKDKISFKLDDIRLIDYYCLQLDLPVILTVCDLVSKTIYTPTSHLRI